MTSGHSPSGAWGLSPVLPAVAAAGLGWRIPRDPPRMEFAGEPGNCHRRVRQPRRTAARSIRSSAPVASNRGRRDRLALRNPRRLEFHCAAARRLGVPNVLRAEILGVTHQASRFVSPTTDRSLVDGERLDIFGFRPVRDTRTRAHLRSPVPSRQRPVTALYRRSPPADDVCRALSTIAGEHGRGKLAACPLK